MIRKALFQVHWLIGITLGLVLALSGLTGGLMAFDLLQRVPRPMSKLSSPVFFVTGWMMYLK